MLRRLWTRHLSRLHRWLRDERQQKRTRSKTVEQPRPRLEVLEDRLAPAAWVAQGPAPAVQGQINVPPDHRLAGAIQAVLPHPTNADVLYVGTVNGGVWRTTNATAANPSWTPLTDNLPGLSIGDVQFDPTDNSFETILVGTGRWSNFARRGDDEVGLYYTTNGGAAWTQLNSASVVGQTFKAVAARGATMLAASEDSGMFRSTNTGSSWTNISGTNGLGAGATLDMADDPGNASRFYAVVKGAGVFRSDDNGGSWTNVTSNIGTSFAGFARIAVHNSGGNNVVYLAIVGASPDQLIAVWRSTDMGANWTQMDTPSIHPGSQGDPNTSLAVHPTNPNLVFIGGDRITLSPFTANIVKGDASLASGSQFVTIVDGNAGNTTPHADSRDMAFDANGNLLQTDDGGIYRRANPTSNSGTWGSVNGNMQAFELHDIAWDPISNIIMTGTQDNGTHIQISTGSLTHTRILGGDGGDVAIDAVTLAGSNQSIRYYSSQNLGSFRRSTYNSSNSLVSTTAINTAAVTDPQFVTPLEVNAVNPGRVLIGGSGTLYEYSFSGNSISTIGGPGANRNAMVFGGSLGGTPNAELIYVGIGNQVWKRNAAGALSNTAGLPSGASTITDVAIDPDNYDTIFAIDDNQVFMSANGGASWSNVTGNLTSISQLDFRTIEYIPGSVVDRIVVGTRSGAFVALAPNFNVWTEFGTGLPDVLVFDLDYNAQDDILVAGSLGRGVWILPNASAITTVQLSSGNLIVNDPSGKNDQINVRKVGANVRVTDSTNFLAAGVGVTQIDANTVEVPFSSITGNIQVNTGTGNDTLTLDYTGASLDLLPSGGLIFDGGENTNDDDRLIVTGYSANLVQVNHTGTESGNVQIDSDGLILFSNIEPLTLGGTAANLVINLPAGATDAVLSDDGVGNDDDGTNDSGFSAIDGAGFEFTQFANPSNSLQIVTAGGSSVVTINAADSGFGPLELRLSGQAGDIFRLGASNVIPDGTSLTVNTVKLDLNGESDTTAGLNGNGVVSNDAASSTSTLTVAANDPSAFSGAIQDGASGKVVALTKSGSGTLVLSGTNTYSGVTTINSGTLQVAGGAALPNSGVVFIANVAGAVLDLSGTNETIGSLDGGGTTGGAVTLGSGTLTVGNTVIGAGNFGGVISGSGSLHVTNSYRQTLGGANAYQGGTQITSGAIIDVISDGNLGNASGGITFDSGTIQANESFSTSRAITLNNSIGSGGGFGVATGKTVTLNGAISGPGGFDKSDFGVLILGNSGNSYAGGTTIGGELRIGHDGNLGAAGTGIVIHVGLLAVTENVTMARPIVLTTIFGSVGFAVTAGKTLTLNAAVSDTSGFGGNNSGFAKVGTGTLILGAANTYTGVTSVSDGMLLVNGSLSTVSAAVNVSAGAVLGGSGTINRPVIVANGATLAPGTSPGILSTGNLTLNSGSTLTVELNSPYAVAGSHYDQVNVAGTVTLDGATLNLVGGVGAPTGTLVITLINNDGSDAIQESGTFAGLAEGATVTVGELTGTISYVGGDGNDVTLTVQKGIPRIVFASERTGNSEIFIMAPDGSGQNPLTTFGGVDTAPALSPDGTKVLFVSEQSGNRDIWVMNSDGTGALQLTSALESDYDPAWSPDGSKIVFASERDPHFDAEIYVMNADGTGQTRITNDTSSDRHPAWSPDGSRIIFTTRRTVNNDIFAMDPNGDNLINLTNMAGNDVDPEWSPDGTKIAFASDRTGTLQIFVMNANGSLQTNVSDNAVDDRWPTWSPDGSQIAFTSFRTGLRDIYVMDADGSNQTRITTDAAADEQPDWGTIPSFTSITLDASNNLIITDATAGGKDDTLAIQSDTTLGVFIIRDPNNTFTTSIAEATGNGTGVVTIPFSEVTGQIQVNTLGGNDELIVDFSLGTFSLPIVYNGGNPTSGAGDKLSVTGGSTAGAFTTVTHNLTSANAGNIDFGGQSAIITYTGLEPVDMTGTDADNLVFNLPAGGSTAFLEDDGTIGNGVSQLRSNPTTFELTTFSNPNLSLTINRGAAADTLTVSGLPDFNRSLTVGSASGPFDQLTVTGAINLASGFSLSADANLISLNSADAAVTTLGAGTVALTAVRNMVLVGGAAIATADGGITLHANQGSAQSGNFVGIALNGATVTTSGSGNINILGRGGDDAGSILHHGVLLQGSTVISSTDVGQISITGTGGVGSESNYGVVFNDTATVASSGTGTVTIEGTGGSAGNFNFGVRFDHTGTKISSLAGAIEVIGTGGAGSASSGIWVNNSAQTVIDTSAGTATTTFIADHINIGIAPASLNAGTNVFALRPKTVGTAINIGGADAAGILGLSGAELDRISAGTIRIGNSDTGTITVTDDIQHTGDDNFVVTTGRNIVFNSGTSWTTADGNVTFSANQQATFTSGNFVGIDVNGAAISSIAGGDIVVQGRGGDSGALNSGVHVHGGGTISGGTAGASLLVEGTGGASSDNGNFGVYVVDSGSQITSAGADVQVTGAGGGSGTSAGNVGVRIESSGLVTAGGSASVTIDGTGGATTGITNLGVYVFGAGSQITSGGGAVQVTGLGGGAGASSNNFGVVLEGGAVTTGGGDITVTGAQGAGSFPGSEAVALSDGGNITAGGSANITVVADSILIDTDGTNGTGSVTAGANNVTLIQKTIGHAIDIGGADVLATTLGLADAELDLVSAGTINIGNSVTGAITVTSAIQHLGDDNFVVTTGRNIVVNPGASWTTTAGDLTFSANQQATPTAGNFAGIDVNGGTLTTNGAGNLLLQGRGGDDPLADEQFGVGLRNGGVVSSTGAGTITLIGQGGTGDDNNAGVGVTGDTNDLIPDSRVTSATGDIQITGSAAGFGQGVVIWFDGIVSSTGTALVTIDGTGGPAYAGVEVTRGRVTSVDGDIDITGAGGNGVGNAFEVGVYLNFLAEISSTGAAAITVRGTGGTGTDASFAYGVDIEDANILSDSGAIHITGVGGGGGPTSSGDNVGVFMTGGQIASSFFLPITITGTGGAGLANNYGVEMFNGAVISSIDGAIEITGQGGGSALGSDNTGVLIFDDADVFSTGSGGIVIDGTGGLGIANNDGVEVTGLGTQITAQDGAVGITGAAGGGADVFGFDLNDEALISTTGLGVFVVADSVNIDATSSIDAGGGEVSLKPQTDGTEIDLGGADAAGTLGLTDAELDRITAGLLTIGATFFGNIRVTAPIDLTEGPSIATTHLSTASAILGNGANQLTTNALSLLGLSGIGVDGDPFSFNSTALETVSTEAQFLDEADNTSVTGLEAFNAMIHLLGGVFTTTASHILGNASSFNVNNATLAIGAFDDSVGGVTLTAGSITGTAGTLTSATDFDVQSGTITAALGGSVGLTKTTAGTVTIGGPTASTYTGTTTILDGTLRVVASAPSAAPGSLGTATSAVLLGDTSGANSVTLIAGIGGGDVTVGRDIDVRAGSSGASTIRGHVSVASDAFFTGNIALGKDVTLDTVSGVTHFSGAISGSGFGVTKTGGGVMAFSGTTENTYTGLTTVDNGLFILNKTPGKNAIPGDLTIDFAGEAVRLNASDQIADTSLLTIQTGAFNLLDASETIGALQGSGGSVVFGTSSGAVFTVGDSSDRVFGGLIHSNFLAQGDQFVKTGTGKLTLTGANEFDGSTLVNQGTLLINNPGSWIGPITVNNSGTLGGTGTISDTVEVNSGGTVAPGTSPGILNTGSVDFSGGGDFMVEFNGPTPDTDHDQLDVTGSVALGAAVATLTLVGGYAFTPGDEIILINNDQSDPVTGFFAGRPEGAVVIVGSFQGAITYQGGDGNDVSLVTLVDIGDRVWHDQNGNGIQDIGEPGIAGAVVELFDSVDGIVDDNDFSYGTRVTDATGTYNFSNLAQNPTNHYLVFRPPVGFTFTAKDVGGNDVVDSDANPADGYSDLFPLTVPSNNFDAGLVGDFPGFGFALGAGSNGIDEGHGVATDSQGNVVHVGTFAGTVDFDPGPGNVSLTASSNDAFIAKYTSVGALIWARSFSGGFDEANSVAVDGDDNIIFAGSIHDGGSHEIIVVKYDADGNLLWNRQYGAGITDIARGIATDSANNVLVGGQFQATVDFDPANAGGDVATSGTDAFVLKLDAAGNFVWVRDTSGQSVFLKGLAVDPSGDVVATGQFNGPTDFGAGTPLGSAGNDQIFIWKLDSAGGFGWAKEIGGSGNDNANAVTIDSAGNVYTTGSFRGSADFDPGAGTAILRGGSYDVYVTRTFMFGTVTTFEGRLLDTAFISKLDSAGAYVYAKALTPSISAPILEDAPTVIDVLTGVYGLGIAVDSNQNVYTTGTFEAPLQTYTYRGNTYSFQGRINFDPGFGLVFRTADSPDVYVSRLDASGNFIYAKTFAGAGDEAGLDIAVDAASNAYVTGTYGSATDFDPSAGAFIVGNAGSNDAFLAKLGQPPPVPETTVVLIGGNLVITDDNGGVTDDLLTISLVGANVRVYDPVNILTAGGGATQVDPHTVEVPLASISGAIQVNTLQGDDRLTVDYAGGAPLPSAGLDFDGGENALDNDQLIVTGYNVGLLTVNHTGAESGSVQAGAGAATIRFDHIEPLALGGTADDIVINLPATANDAVLEDNGVAGDGVSLLRSTNGSFEVTPFNNPASSLTINAGTGADNLTIENLPDFIASLTVHGDGDGDSITLNAPLNLGSATALGDLVLDAETINLNAGINTDAAGVNAGAVSLLGNVNLGADVLIDTDAPASDGSILFNGAVAAVSSQALNLTAGSGNITFTGTVGAGSTEPGLISINSAHHVDFQQSVAVINALTQMTGTGTTTFNGVAAGILDVITDTIVLNTAAVQTTADVDLNAQNAIAVNVDVNAGGGTINIAANQDGADAQGFTQAAGTTIETTNSSALAVNVNVNTAGGGTGNASVAAVQGGAGSTITVNANGGAIVDANGALTNVTGGFLNANAATGIDLDTNVATITAVTTAAGAILLDELDGVTLTDVTAANGPITITTGGSAVVTNVVSSIDSDVNDISITAAAGDLTVETVAAGTGTDGDVTLTATTGNIFDDGLNGTLITADNLSLTAIQAIGQPGATAGIDAAANILDAAATGVFVSGPTPGIWLFDADSLILNDVDTVDGVIVIDADGNLDAQDVVAGGAGRNIRLRALGGDLHAGSITATGDTVLLDASGAISDGDAGVDVTALRLSLRSGAGVAGPADALETAVSELAALGGAGGVFLANAGALAITTIIEFSVTTTGIAGTGAAEISAASPLTLASNVLMGGDVLLSAGEIADAGTCADDLTVNPGITVQSAAGNVTLRAGDDIILGAGATIQAALDVELIAGFNDLDNCGDYVNNGGTITAGADLAICAIGDVPASGLTANLITGTVSLRSMNGAIIDLSGPTPDILAFALAMKANTGIGVGDALETIVSRLEAETVTGGIFVVNTGDLAVGGVTPAACVGPLAGVRVTGASGAIDLDNSGAITILIGGDSAVGPAAIDLTATTDILTGGGQSAVVSSGGTVTLDADRDLLLGDSANGLFGSVKGGGSIVLVAGRHIVIDDQTFIDAHGAGAIDATAGGDIVLTNTNVDDARITSEGGIITLRATGAVLTDARSIGISTTFGGAAGADVTICGDTITLNDSVDAGDGTVRLAATGDIFAPGGIRGGSLGVRSLIGSIDLDNASNQVANTFAARTDGIGASIDFANLNSFVTGQITPFDCFTQTVTGVTTPGGRAELVSSLGGITLGTAGVTGSGVSAGVVLLQSGDGDITQTVEGAIVAQTLAVFAAVFGSGDVILCAAANQVSAAAINMNTGPGLIEFHSEISWTIIQFVNPFTGIAFAAQSVNGLSSSGGDINVRTGGSLFVEYVIDTGGAGAILGDARIVAAGSVSQGTVSSVSGISADELGIRAGGEVTLCESPDNDVNILAVSAPGLVEFRGQNGLTIGTVLAGGNCGFTDTTGISDDGARLDADVSLNVSFALHIEKPVLAGAGDVRIVTVGFNAVVDQTAQGVIVADGLGITATASVNLAVAANDVNILAINTTAGGIDFHDVNGLTLGAVAAGGCGFTGATGLNSNDADINLCIDAGDLNINAPIDAGSGVVRLAAETGSVLQTANGVVTGSGLGVRALGDIVLDAASNFISSTLAAATGQFDAAISFRNAVGFATGQIDPAGCIVLAVTGVTTNGGAIGLCADSGTIAIGTTGVSASGINTGLGNIVRLQATGGNVTQAAEGAILSDLLGVNAAGSVTLTAAANHNDALAVAASGLVEYRDLAAVTISAIAASGCFTSDVVGVYSNGGNINLQTGGNLTLTDAQDGPGSIDAGAGDVRIVSGGFVIQLNADDFIRADELGIRSGGTINLAGDNDVNTLAAVAASGAVDFRDLNALTIGEIAAGGTAGFTMTAGLTTNSADINVCVDAGALSIFRDVVAGSGTVRLAVPAGGINSNSAVIVAAVLSVQAGAFVDLDNSSHAIQTILAASVSTGDFHFRNAGGFTIGQAPGGGCVAATVTGVNVGATAVLVSDSGPITIGTLVAGTGITAATVGLRSGSSVDQTAQGVVAANDLLIQAGGSVTLCAADNDVTRIAVRTTGLIEFNDSDDLTIASLSVAATSFTTSINGVSSNGGDINLQTDTSLDISQPLDAGTGDVRIVAGTSVNGSSFTRADALGIRAGTTVFLPGDVNTLAVAATGAITYFNLDNLTVGTVLGGGNCGFTTTSGVVSSGAGDVRVETADLGGGNEDLTILAGHNVQAAGGAVLLIAGDDITLQATAIVQAATDVLIFADFLFDGDAGLGAAVHIAGTITNGGNATVMTGADEDTITLLRKGAGPITLDAGGGGDDYFVQLGNLAGVVTVNDTGATTGDELDVVGTANSETVFVNNASLTSAAEVVNYFSIEFLDVFGMGANDTFNVRSTNATTTTLIDGGAGEDAFNISSDAPATNGNLDGILGALTIEGGSGVFNRIVANDAGGAPNTAVAILDNLIAGFAPAIISYRASGGQFNVAGGDGIVLRGSNNGGDLFQVISILAGSTTRIEGLDGADTFANATGDLDSITGRLTIIGGAPVPFGSIDCDANPIGTRDVLLLNDRADGGLRNYVVGPNGITSSVTRPFAGVFFDGTMDYVRLDGTDEVNIFDVSPSQTTQFFIDGNLPPPGVCSPGGGDFLRLNTAGATGRRLHIDSVGKGHWGFTSGHRDVCFESIERFNHVDIVAVANAKGVSRGASLVKVYDAETFEFKFQVLAYEAFFRGGVRVATGDVNCDGLPDLVTASGPGRRSTVKAFNGSPNNQGQFPAQLITAFNVYRPQFKDGFHVAVGDVNHDGANDIITGADAGWLPMVSVFDGTTLTTTHSQIGASFLGFGNHFRGGVRVAAGDINNDGRAEIIAASGPGQSGRINVYDGASHGLVNSFVPFGANYKNGLFVAVGDVNGDGIRDIVASVDKNWLPLVSVFNGNTVYGGNPAFGAAPELLASFQAFTNRERTGVRIAVKPVDGGNPGSVEKVSILMSSGPGGRIVSRKISQTVDFRSLGDFGSLTPAVVDRVFENARVKKRKYVFNGIYVG